MDKVEIKEEVIKLRETGYTFEDISKILEQEYGVKRSRQALAKIYSRYKSKDAILCKYTEKIMSMKILGYSNREIASQINKEIDSEDTKDSYKIKIQDVDNIVNDNSGYIEDIKKSNINMVRECITMNEDRNNIMDRLNWKDIKVSEEEFNNIVTKAIKLEEEGLKKKYIK